MCIGVLEWCVGVLGCGGVFYKVSKWCFIVVWCGVMGCVEVVCYGGMVWYDMV